MQSLGGQYKCECKYLASLIIKTQIVIYTNVIFLLFIQIITCGHKYLMSNIIECPLAYNYTRRRQVDY